MTSIRTVCWPGASGNASVYDALLEGSHFAERPLVVDYPGLGASPARPAVNSLSSLYDALVDDLPERFRLVAVSMGCVLALRAALEHPQRVAQLVLIAAAGGVDVPALGGSDWRSGWVTRRPQAPRWFIEDRSDYSDRLGEIQCPTLLVFGDADPIAPVAVGRYLHERLARSTLEVLAGADHNLVEQRAPEVGRAIVRHFAEAERGR